MKSYLPLTAGDQTFRLRLTMAGQKALRDKWGEDILTLLLSAAGEGEKLCDLLTQALTWPGNDNPIQEGEALYDLLVDQGWRGQAAFAGLAFDLGEAAGLLTKDQVRELKDSVDRAFAEAFGGLKQP